ncbi:hypothetical protein LFM09_49225 [Lentzea alba]|uniref:hypothetical protein n=1 Tax=Lentzea alba TaxID=2714351 RepID=UPI0039BF0EDF
MTIKRAKSRVFAGVAAVAAALTLGAMITPTASAADWNCTRPTGSSDGHNLRDWCDAGPGTAFWVVGEFCGPGSCTQVGGTTVAYRNVSAAASPGFWTFRYKRCANNGVCTGWRDARND